LKKFLTKSFIESMKMNLYAIYAPFWNDINVNNLLILLIFLFVLTQSCKTYVSFFLDQTLRLAVFLGFSIIFAFLKRPQFCTAYLPYSRYYKTHLYRILRLFGATCIQFFDDFLIFMPWKMLLGATSTQVRLIFNSVL